MMIRRNAGKVDEESIETFRRHLGMKAEDMPVAAVTKSEHVADRALQIVSLPGLGVVVHYIYQR